MSKKKTNHNRKETTELKGYLTRMVVINIDANAQLLSLITEYIKNPKKL